METWYKRMLGDGSAASGTRLEIHQAYMENLEEEGSQAGLAVFTYYDLEKHLLTAYFTPPASALAKRFHAVPCDKPEPKIGLDLLAGHGNNWQLYFPGFKDTMAR